MVSGTMKEKRSILKKGKMKSYNLKNSLTIVQGDSFKFIKKILGNSIDLVVTSPPYCMNKEYEKTNDIQSFIDAHEKILPEIVRITKDGGSICWQVGYHVKDGEITPLDYLVHDHTI